MTQHLIVVTTATVPTAVEPIQPARVALGAWLTLGLALASVIVGTYRVWFPNDAVNQDHHKEGKKGSAHYLCRHYRRCGLECRGHGIAVGATSSTLSSADAFELLTRFDSGRAQRVVDKRGSVRRTF